MVVIPRAPFAPIRRASLCGDVTSDFGTCFPADEDFRPHMK